MGNAYRHNPQGPSESDLRAARNCEGKGSGEGLDLPEGLTGCPRSHLEPEVWGWLEAYRRWKLTGGVPFRSYGPTLGSQPRFVEEAFTIFEAAAERAQAREGERTRQALARLEQLTTKG